MYIKNLSTDFLKIDTPQMVEVDRLMIEEYHIELLQMMENAGRCLAIVAREVYLNQDPQGKRICVLAGTGGNGGGAMVSARRLSGWGAEVDVYTTATDDKMTQVPKHQFDILKKLDVTIYPQSPPIEKIEYDLIIDGIIGYSIQGNPIGIAKEMIDWANLQMTKVISLDTPSGLDLSTGRISNPTISANATLTLAMPKRGLFEVEASKIVGQLYLGDIGVPIQLYSQPTLKLDVENLFRYSDIIRITTP